MSQSTKTQSGRSQAVARRQAKKSGSTSAVPARATRGSNPQAQSVGNVSSRNAVSSSQPVVVAEGREAAKQRRKQVVHGQSAQANTQPQVNRRKPKPEPILEPRAKSETKPKARSSVSDSSSQRAQVKSAPVAMSSGRQMSKARRKAKVKGKVGESAYKSGGNQASLIAQVANPGASGRDIARSVRAERCTRGKCGSSTSSETAKKRQSRRSRSGGAPDKVGFSETLSGQAVSGTQVGQSESSLTGVESGACQLVSGTEYLGMEEFASSCSTSPSAAPAKVTTTQTTKGQAISGSRMGQSKAVSGDRSGICSGVTGTDYLPADQSNLFCGAEAAKVKKPNGGFSVAQGPSAPSNVDSGKRVSGGNDFPVQSGSIQPSSGDVASAPKKVMMSNTFAGVATSGTQVGRTDTAVTGVEEGYCQAVTGTGYQGQEEVETVCHNPAAAKPARKSVGVSGSFSSRQDVTGDRSTAPLRATGENKGSFSIASSIVNQSGVMPGKSQVEAVTGHSLTGAQPGPQGLTGAQTGACELITGTQYQGVDQTNLMCEGSHAAVPGESDFPVMIGSVQPVDMSQPLPDVESMSNTNVITGDGWDSGSKVTGTGGPSAVQRNPSVRGMSGQTPMSASGFRPNSMPEVPPSPITGSAGNTSDGAKVTLSGGARA